jgi:hypothetical protein
MYSSQSTYAKVDSSGIKLSSIPFDSVGSTVSDMIAAWIELWRVDVGEPEG